MIFDRLRAIIARQLDVDPEMITLSTDIMNELGADSLDIVELITLIEDEFNIMITDESVANMNVVGQFVEYLEGKL